MGGWNLWKLTAIAMVLVTSTAVVTGLVVAYWSGSAPERGLKQAAVSSPPAPPQAPSRQPTAPAPQSRASTVPRQVTAKPQPAVSPQPAATPQPAPRVPTQEAIDACNRYAAEQAGLQDKAMPVAKDAVIGAVAGAAVGAPAARSRAVARARARAPRSGACWARVEARSTASTRRRSKTSGTATPTPSACAPAATA